MISVFYGSDRNVVQDKARAFLDGVLKRGPGLQVVSFEPSEESSERVKALAAGTSLFGEKYLICLRYFCETIAGRELLLSLLPHLKESAHECVIVDGNLTKEPLTKLEEAGAKLQKFMKVEAGGYAGAREVKVSHPIFAGYNIYNFSDAFGARDKKRLWVEYELALAAGLPAEELFWKISWQLKHMLIASKITPTDKTDLKQYSLNKAKSFLRSYKPAELPNISMKLIDIYHRARRGQSDFETSLERFVLEL